MPMQCSTMTGVDSSAVSGSVERSSLSFWASLAVCIETSTFLHEVLLYGRRVHPLTEMPPGLWVAPMSSFLCEEVSFDWTALAGS